MRQAILLVILVFAATRAQAVDSVFAEAGAGNSIDIGRVGVTWKWGRSWAYGDRWHVTGAWEGALGELRGDKPGDNDQVIWDIGVTPVFRLARNDDADAPYFEGGFLGLHLLSRAFAYNGKKLGSGFQFGHFLGVGADFGARRQFSLSYRFQHMSNAGIVEPNQGINLNELHFVYFY